MSGEPRGQRAPGGRQEAPEAHNWLPTNGANSSNNNNFNCTNQNAGQLLIRMEAGSGGEGASANQQQQLAYPQYAPLAFFYFKQTCAPRSWCLAVVSNKYPVHSLAPLGRPATSASPKLISAPPHGSLLSFSTSRCCFIFQTQSCK